MQMQAPLQIKQVVGLNIAAARADLNESRRAFGERIGVDQMLVYKWERGLHHPSAENMAALAVATRRDVSWFYVNRERKDAA